MKYFTLSELCRSNTAELNHIDNTPNAEQVKNLENLVKHCLDPLREAWGAPIIVNSGFRCPKVNSLVGGKWNSQHMLGMAADIRPVHSSDCDKLFSLAYKVCAFDQLLLEHTKKSPNNKWIHISCRMPITRNRRNFDPDYVKNA